jgi:hypothetical protein
VPMLGPIETEELIDLDGVQFALAVRIETDASKLTCRQGRFPGGVRFDVRRAVVRLDNSDLSTPSLLTGPPVSDPAGITNRPRVLSLQGANVAGLTFGNVSLADCRFAGAHNLDKLRVEADTVFGLSPAVAGWERRQVIAEETALRAARARHDRWRPRPWLDPAEDQPKPLSPGVIAGLYRALRKGVRTPKMNPAQPTSTTARWRCAVTTEEQAAPTTGGAGPLASCLPLTGWSLATAYGPGGR